MGNWYQAPTGMGAGVMGLGYWCFATNVGLTIFQARARARAEAAVAPLEVLRDGRRRADRRNGAGRDPGAAGERGLALQGRHAGDWIDPISHAHINLVTGLTMLVAGALFYLVPLLGGAAPSRRLADTCFFALLGGSLAFYVAALYLGFHEGRLVVTAASRPSRPRRRRRSTRS